MSDTLKVSDCCHSEMGKGRLLSADMNMFVYRDIAEARETWEALYCGADASPYQSFAWFSAWFNEIGAPQGWTAHILVLRDGVGEALALLLLVARRRSGLTLVEFAGGKHSNLNMPLLRSNACSRLNKFVVTLLLDDFASLFEGVVVLRLMNMPEFWIGKRNPLISSAAQPSPSLFYAALLTDEITGASAASPQRRRKINYSGSSRILVGKNLGAMSQ